MEKSYFWQPETGFPTGDSEASYDEVDYQLFVSLMMSIDRRVQGPVFSAFNPFGAGGYFDRGLYPNFLFPNVNVFTGIAIVDGVVYINTAQIDVDCSAAGFHRIVLRTSRSGGTDQTTRLIHLTSGVGYPALTQNANTWEISIARIESSGAAFLATFDDRKFINNNIFVRNRLGTSDEWVDLGGNSYAYVVGPTMILVGATGTPDTAFVVTFPKVFKRAPLVFVTPFNYVGASPNYSNVIYIRESTTQEFTISVDSVTNIAGYNWFAIGPLYDEAI